MSDRISKQQQALTTIIMEYMSTSDMKYADLKSVTNVVLNRIYNKEHGQR